MLFTVPSTGRDSLVSDIPAGDGEKLLTFFYSELCHFPTAVYIKKYGDPNKKSAEEDSRFQHNLLH